MSAESTVGRGFMERHNSRVKVRIEYASEDDLPEAVEFAEWLLDWARSAAGGEETS